MRNSLQENDIYAAEYTTYVKVMIDVCRCISVDIDVCWRMGVD